MKKTRFHSCLAFALSTLAAGCAGELDHNLFPDPPPSGTGAGGSTGTPTSTTATGTSGSGGSGGLMPVTTCVMTSMKGCSATIGCHGKSLPVANLNLTFDSLTTKYKELYYDKPNAGIVPPDPLYCAPGKAKLVDPVNPTQSLIYAKVLTAAERDAMMKPPCGDAMPPTGQAPITDADKACILMWINDVIAGSKASP